jgi:hypothetical protein
VAVLNGGWRSTGIDQRVGQVHQGSIVGEKTTAIALASIAALATGVATGLWLNRPAEPVPDPALARVLARLDALEVDSRRVPVRSSSSAIAGGLDDAKVALASGIASPAMRKQAEAAVQERVRAFESRFSQDPQDAGAAKLEIDMLKTMGAKEMESTGLVAGNPDVECRRHSCRVTADFRGSDDAMEWGLHYVTLLGQGKVSNAQPVVVPNPDGSVRLRMYASRDGS